MLAAAVQWRRAVTKLQTDPLFAKLYRQVGEVPFAPRMNENPLEAFISAIISQQLSTKAAATILQRVQQLVAVRGKPSARKILATGDDAFRAAGLSGMKVSYLKSLAQHSIDGLLPSRDEVELMPDDDIVRRFMAVKGIGRWTVEMYLIFDLGRADVFPVDDYGIRKAIARLHGLPDLPPARNLMPYGDRWQPYRSVASLYLWRSLDNPA